MRRSGLQITQTLNLYSVKTAVKEGRGGDTGDKNCIKEAVSEGIEKLRKFLCVSVCRLFRNWIGVGLPAKTEKRGREQGRGHSRWGQPTFCGTFHIGHHSVCCCPRRSHAYHSFGETSAYFSIQIYEFINRLMTCHFYKYSICLKVLCSHNCRLYLP